ncbi:MAG: hypothetical protein ABMB14_36055, partial [Myxococcota bacterium]
AVIRASGPGVAIVGLAGGRLHGTPQDVAALAPELALAVGRSAWPLDWADPAELPLGPPLPPSAERPVGEPFRTISTAAGPPGEAFLRSTLSGLGVREAPLQCWPIGWYHAPEPLVGAAIDERRVGKLAGRVVMWAEAWRPEHVQIGVLIRSGGGFTTVRHDGNSSGSGGLSLSGLAWIGAAAPLA